MGYPLGHDTLGHRETVAHDALGRLHLHARPPLRPTPSPPQKTGTTTPSSRSPQPDPCPTAPARPRFFSSSMPSLPKPCPSRRCLRLARGSLGCALAAVVGLISPAGVGGGASQDRSALGFGRWPRCGLGDAVFRSVSSRCGALAWKGRRLLARGSCLVGGRGVGRGFCG